MCPQNQCLSGKANRLSGRTNQRLPPGGSSRRSRVRESALRYNQYKSKVARAPSVTLRVPPHPLADGISEEGFRRFESVYRPEKNEIVLRTMKSERSSDEIFGVPPQVKSKPAASDKLNPPPSPAARQISSRSDFIHRRWISSAEGGFS